MFLSICARYFLTSTFYVIISQAPLLRESRLHVSSSKISFEKMYKYEHNIIACVMYIKLAQQRAAANISVQIHKSKHMYSIIQHASRGNRCRLIPQRLAHLSITKIRSRASRSVVVLFRLDEPDDKSRDKGSASI